MFQSINYPGIVIIPFPLIQKTLDRVISGEINRLIINVSPGYTKCTTGDSLIMTTEGAKRASRKSG